MHKGLKFWPLNYPHYRKGIDALMVKSVNAQKSKLQMGKVLTVIASLLIELSSTHKCIFILVMGTINHSTLLNKIHIT